MMENIREIIGRATMALVAIALAVGASFIVRATIHLDMAAVGDVAWLWLFALALYVLAFALICFVFATRDPRKANGAHVVGTRLMEGFGGVLKLLFMDWWIWWI